MKAKIFNKIALLLVLIIGGISSCDKAYEYSRPDIDTDTRLVGKEGFYIRHVSPRTGDEYSDDQLRELGYDPYKGDQYTDQSPVDLTIVVEAKPLNIVVTSTPDQTVLATLTEFTESEGKYLASYSTTVTDLNLGIGESATLLFSVTYDDLGQDGRDYASLNRITYKITRIAKYPIIGVEFFAYLQKLTGELIGLETSDNASKKAKHSIVGSKITFDGVNDKATLTETPSLDFTHTEDFSIGLWVNSTSSESDPAMISDQDWSSSYNKGFTLAFKGATWRSVICDESAQADGSTNGTVPINDGQWHFLAVTFDRDGDMKMYQDGIEVSSTDMSSVGNIDNGNPIRFAQDGTGEYSKFFAGNIGNAYIFDYVLDPADVKAMSLGATGVELRRQSAPNKNLAITDASSGIVNEDGFVGFEFDGVDDLATIDDTDLDFRIAGDFSVSTWVKTTATNSDPSILGDKDWGSGNNPGFVMTFTGGDWKINLADDDRVRIDVSGGIVNDGEWHMLTATIDRDGLCNVYQDGVLVSSKDMSHLGAMTSGYPVRIAQDGTGTYSHWFGGKVANSIIFDYALTKEEVFELYSE
ncbi:MAG: LamG domain-containing protein [Carboxylicivirga sp.]|jgi:hypothetical protein|nr:LamG domain-containing protein [Carboxylicivirga sp.]